MIPDTQAQLTGLKHIDNLILTLTHSGWAEPSHKL